jgi:hypothetical protein
MKGSPARRKRAPRTGSIGLRRLIQKVERNLNAKIDQLRSELQASETAAAAARLHDLNERRATEGVSRLRQDLNAQREAGIIDGKGKRLSPELPASMTDPASDVV